MRRRLTFRQIEAFRAAMLTGSITEGAELMSLTQPAASRLIADLESAVNLRVFERRGNRIVATTEGILLYHEVEKSFSGLDRIERAAIQIGSNWLGMVRIIAMAGPSMHFLPKLIGAVMRDHAKAFFMLSTAMAPVILDRVAMRQYDLGFAYAPVDYPGVEIEPLEGLEAVCAVPVSHPLASVRQIKIDDLGDQPFLSLGQDSRIWQKLEYHLKANGIAPKIVFEATTSQAICVMAAEGIGIGVVDPFTAAQFYDPRVTIKTFLPSIAYPASLIYPANVPRSSILTIFTNLIRKASIMQELLNRHDLHPNADAPPHSEK
jgi:DNA-binding transcriptional LysR family regulator